jgi:hypothetical protein
MVNFNHSSQNAGRPAYGNALLQEEGFSSSPLRVHNVPLVEKQIPTEMLVVGYKPFSFLVYPVSDEVVDDQ